MKTGGTKKNRRALSDLIFVIVILFLASASFISYQRITKQNQSSSLVAHANLVRFKLGQALTTLRGAEKKEQDSIHAGNDLFRIHLTEDSLFAFQLVYELDSLMKDDTYQHTQILKLNSLLKKWLDNLKREHTRAEKLSADLSNFSMEGQALMNRIQLLFIEMRHYQDDNLLEKIQEKDRTAFLIPLYALIFSFIAIILVSGTYFRLRSETRLRKRAQGEQAVIHNFFQQAPAMLAILKGPDHVFEFVNQPFQELIGSRNPVNLPVRDVIPEATGQGYYEILDSVYKSGDPFIGKEMALQVNRGNKEESIYINLICQVLKNTSGETDGVLVFCYDVSEQVSARNQLQQSESRSRLAIEAARMGTFDWDLQNEHFISSERLVEIFGYHNASEISHQDLINRFHPEDKPIRDRAVKNSYTTGSLSYEARLVWTDKSIHWINVYGKIFSDDARNILRMYGTVVDVTPQKIALEEIKESEAKFRLLANAMPQQIWTADKNGNLNYFNQAVYDYSGLNSGDIENKGWLSFVHPDDLKVNIKKWTESVNTGIEFNMEHRFRNFNGEYRWQLSRAIPQMDDQDNIQMWIGSSTDIQEQKHFMQELEKSVIERTESMNYANLVLKQTVSDLEQSNAELASFNYIASHDLQEPLRKIIAFSKRIEDLDQAILSDLSKDYFSRIILATGRMQNLIDAFLSYSQTSNIRAAFEPTDFNAVFNEVKNDFAEAIEQKKIRLESQPLPSLMSIPLQIDQLLTNLIGNAIKYSRTDVDSKIEIFAEELHGRDLLFEGVDTEQFYWKISIRDNGIGFDQAYETQIFELFQRLHKRHEYAGTGIGLAICKKIMRNHRGYISATGYPGSGAEFSMYFPSLFVD
jgi:PAS domain S-box-containing protein